MKKAIAVFDIGKTNKKILLFDENLKLVFREEEKFRTILDEDGDECDDLDKIEKWILDSLASLVRNNEYELTAVNFSTYGASLVFIGEDGKKLTPLYNYLKKVPEEIPEILFSQYGGKTEFCRKTATPALGLLLNSGIQILWLKQKKPEVFKRVQAIMHFPQYLSYVLTKAVVSESTSIGCHSFLWDFNNGSYHQWLEDQDISLPDPLPNSYTIPVEINRQKLNAGIGIHDSSASIVPYIRGSRENFMLLSTGTWCINMNPFNHTPLTAHQLERDCLCYLSIDQTPVMSSQLFMGRIHDVNVKRISDHFHVAEDSLRMVKTDEELLSKYIGRGKELTFFKYGIPENYLDEKIDLSLFKSFSEAYHRLMYDLTILNSKSMNLISDEKDGVRSIYVSGGFARNEIFIRLLASFYPDKRVFTSEVNNSSALGAALAVWDSMPGGEDPEIDLGLMEWNPIEVSGTE